MLTPEWHNFIWFSYSWLMATVIRNTGSNSKLTDGLIYRQVGETYKLHATEAITTLVSVRPSEDITMIRQEFVTDRGRSSDCFLSINGTCNNRRVSSVKNNEPHKGSISGAVISCLFSCVHSIYQVYSTQRWNLRKSVRMITRTKKFSPIQYPWIAPCA